MTATVGVGAGAEEPSNQNKLPIQTLTRLCSSTSSFVSLQLLQDLCTRLSHNFEVKSDMHMHTRTRARACTRTHSSCTDLLVKNLLALCFRKPLLHFKFFSGLLCIGNLLLTSQIEQEVMITCAVCRLAFTLWTISFCSSCARAARFSFRRSFNLCISTSKRNKKERLFKLLLLFLL